jgi:hypothetical protein
MPSMIWPTIGASTAPNATQISTVAITAPASRPRRGANAPPPSAPHLAPPDLVECLARLGRIEA